ncbi:dystonin [Sarotherodon galilaeus]
MCRKSDRYSSIGDEDLDAKVLDIQRHHPNAGCRMMMGHLRSRGIYIQRFRLMDSMRRVNPEGVKMRRLSIQTARRRQYSVPAPNHLWHIDGNHKLIRIERLWRDVYENVLDLFYTIFTQLEIQGLLNPGEEIDLFALHRCFLHHIQHHLQSFQEAWNQHGLRTANNHSPLQLWLLHRKEGQDLSQVDEDYGVDWTGPHNHRPSNEITIPEIQLPRALNERELAVLPNNNVSLSQALDAYCETVQSLKLMFDTTP